CTSGRIEAHHHHGYYPRAAWTDVEWLCPACHGAADALQRQNCFSLVQRDTGNEVMEAFRKKADAALAALSLADDESLYKATVECKGEDECHVFLNVFACWMQTAIASPR